MRYLLYAGLYYCEAHNIPLQRSWMIENKAKLICEAGHLTSGFGSPL